MGGVPEEEEGGDDADDDGDGEAHTPSASHGIEGEQAAIQGVPSTSEAPFHAIQEGILVRNLTVDFLRQTLEHRHLLRQRVELIIILLFL